MSEVVLRPDDLRDCFRCPVLVEHRSQVVGVEVLNPEWMGRVPTMMWVARNPGRREDGEGRPLIGRAGQVARRLSKLYVASSGESAPPLATLIFNNLIKCWTPQDRKPTPEEIDNCAPFINREVEEFNPNIIVLMGLEAQEYRFKNKEDRHHLRVDDKNRVWVATYHPSYAARGTHGAEEQMAKDILAAYMVGRGIWEKQTEVHGLMSAVS